jgi:DNA (cytosine-5)-methyltransferase 1
MKSKNEKTHLDLFSGIGGFALAAKWNGYRTVGFCDNEPYAQAVLKKHWPEVPCHKDIREVRGELYAGVTLLTGGFPCQPFSIAGKQGGKNDDRYLWPEMLRVIREARPTWIIGENVAGIVNMALDQVHTDLEAEGYEVESIIIPACAVDAPHRRDRVWIVAHSKLHGNQRTEREINAEADCVAESFGTKYCSTWQSIGTSEQQRRETEQRHDDVADTCGERQFWHQRKRQASEEGVSSGHASQCCSQIFGEDVADTVNQGWQGRVHRREDAERQGVDGHAGCCGSTHGQSGEATWLPEPNVGRVAHGIPNRVAKLRGLGNAIVPQVAAEIIRCINQVMEDKQNETLD